MAITNDISLLPKKEIVPQARPFRVINSPEEYEAGVRELGALRLNNPARGDLQKELQRYKDAKRVMRLSSGDEQPETREGNINVTANLMRDWEKYPEAKQAVIAARGQEFADQYERLHDYEKFTLQLDEVMNATEGGNNPMAQLEYCDRYNLPREPKAIIEHFRKTVVDPINVEGDAWRRGNEIANDILIEDLATGNRSGYDPYSREGIHAADIIRDSQKDFDEAKGFMGVLQRLFDQNDLLPDAEPGSKSYREWVRYGNLNRNRAELLLARLKLENERAYSLVINALDRQAREGQQKNIPALGQLLKPIRSLKGTVYYGRQALGYSDLLDADLTGEQQKVLAPYAERYRVAMEALPKKGREKVEEYLKFPLEDNESAEDRLGKVGKGLTEGEQNALREGLVFLEARRPLYEKLNRTIADVGFTLQNLADRANSIPEDSSWLVKIPDLIGGAGGDTIGFITSYGATTFADIAGRKFYEIRREHALDESALRAIPYGAAEVVAESLAFGKVGKAITYGATKIPFAGKAVGKAGEYLKNGKYFSKAELRIARSVPARLAYQTATGGSIEFLEEFMTDTLAMPVDRFFAELYGSTDGPTLDDWKEAMSETLSVDTAVSMYGFAFLMGGLGIRGMRRDAQLLSMNKDALMGLGIPAALAEDITKTTTYDERVGQIRDALSQVDMRSEETKRTIREGLENLSTLVLTPDAEAFQAMMDSGEIDRFRRNEDGTFTVTRRDTGERVVLSEEAASSLMVSQLSASQIERAAEAQDLIATEALVDRMKTEGTIFERMDTPGETVETIRELAARAQLLIDEGADPNSIVPNISENVPLGELSGAVQVFEEREGIARNAGDVVEKGISYAYNLRLRDGRNVVRFAEGRMNFLELLEEKIEIDFAEQLENGRDLGWWRGYLAETQDFLKSRNLIEGDLIATDRAASKLEVREAVSRIARGVALSHGRLNGMPESVNFFMGMIRGIVDSALSLAKVGKGFEAGVKAGHINADFARDVYEIAGIGGEYWRGEAKRAERSVQDKGKRAAKKADVSFSMREFALEPGYNFNLGGWENQRNQAKRSYWKRVRGEVNSIRKEARIINETGKEGADIVSRLHHNLGVVRAATVYLPEALKVRTRPYVTRLEMLAELASTGKVTLTRDINKSAATEINRGAREASADVREDLADEVKKAWADKRASELLEELIGRVDEQLEGYLKKQITDRIDAIIKSTRPKKGNSGRIKKGKLGIDAQRVLDQSIIPALNMTAAEKESSVNTLLGEINTLLNESDTMESDGKLGELNSELTTLAVYGNLKGMSLEEAETALTSLERFVKSGRLAWDVAEDRRKEKIRERGRVIVQTFNRYGKKATPNSLRDAEVKARKGITDFMQAGDIFESLPQFFIRLESYSGTKAMASELRTKIAKSYQNLERSSSKRDKAVDALYNRILTPHVLNRVNVKNVRQWENRFKKTETTDIRLKNTAYESVYLPINEARDLVEMSAESREIQRREVSGTPSEKAIPAIRKFLDEYDKGQGRARRYVDLKVPHRKLSDEFLNLSRDNALYIILLSEQEDYRETLKDQGYDEKVLGKLREFVGEEGLAVGYGLRDLLEKNGDRIIPKYEKITGVPFPRVENYYSARFVTHDKIGGAEAVQMLAGVPSLSGGNNNTWQMLRVNHNRAVDTSVGALGVFYDATDMMNNWFHTHDVVDTIRGLIQDRSVAESLVVNLGKDDFVRLKAWVSLMERSGQEQGKSHGKFDRIVSAIYAGKAKAILAYRVETIIRQGSAVLNAWAGDPTIGLTEWLATLTKVKHGKAPMGIIRMLKSDLFQDRRNGDLTERLTRLGNDETVAAAEKAILFGMNGIENTDVFLNAIGSSAIWNIYYARGIEAGMTDIQSQRAAWDAVRRSLNASAQPQGWYEKTFSGVKSNSFSRAIHFMMSENFNKVGLIYSYAFGAMGKGNRKKSLFKAAQVWGAYGAVNAIIGAILDLMRDDEERRRKRTIKGYIGAALAGPLSGTPIVGEGIEWLCQQLFGLEVYSGSTGRAIIDLTGSWNAGQNIYYMKKNGGYDTADYIREGVKFSSLFGLGGLLAGKAVGESFILAAALMNPVKTVLNLSDATGATKRKRVRKE